VVVDNCMCWVGDVALHSKPQVVDRDTHHGGPDTVFNLSPKAHVEPWSKDARESKVLSYPIAHGESLVGTLRCAMRAWTSPVKPQFGSCMQQKGRNRHYASSVRRVV